MTLSGGKFLCLGENGEVEKVFEPKAKTFRIGYYMSCDFIHEHPEANGIHCEIDCDAFGRIFVKNLCLENPISVNGCIVKGSRPLLNGNIIEVLGKRFRWEYIAANITTPDKKALQVEQSATSEPSSKERKIIQKRLTVHSFSYGLNSQLEEPVELEAREANQDIPGKSGNGDNKALGRVNSKELNLSDTENLENTLSLSKNLKRDVGYATPKAKLSLCRPSEIVLTSYSPSTPGSKLSKSFACVTPLKTPPRSLYSTPKGILLEQNVGGESSEELIDFKTPNAAKLKNVSMHLIDFMTPMNVNTPMQHKSSSFLKSALKNSVKSLPKSATIRNKFSNLNDSKLKQDKRVQNTPTRSSKRDLNLQPEQPVDKSIINVNEANKSSASLGQDTSKDFFVSQSQMAHITLDSTSSTINLDSTDVSEMSIIEISTDDLSGTSVPKQVVKGTPKKNTSLVRKALITSARKVQNRSVKPKSESKLNNSKVVDDSAVKNRKFKMNEDKTPDKQKSTRLSLSTTIKKRQSSKHNCNLASQSLIIAKSSFKKLTSKQNTSLGLPNVLTTSTPLKGRKSIAATIHSTPKQVIEGNLRRHSCINSNLLTPVNTKTPKKNFAPSERSVKKNKILIHSNDKLEKDGTLGEIEERLNSTFTMDSQVFPTDKEEFNLIGEEITQEDEQTKAVANQSDFALQNTFKEVDKFKIKESTAANNAKASIVFSEKNEVQKEYSEDILEVNNRTLLSVTKLKEDKKCKGEDQSTIIAKYNCYDIIRPTGIKELFDTPKPEKDDNLEGIKELVKTPKASKGSIDNLTGIKELVKTPRDSQRLKENLVGLKELLKTPKSCGKNTENFVGLRELVKTPKIHQNYEDFLGVHDLLQTPRGIYKPRNELDNYEVAFKTPSAKRLMVLGTPQSINVHRDGSSAELLEPVECDLRENMEEMEDLFQTPGVPKIINQVEEKDSAEEELTAEQSFDILVGRPIIKQNYSRQGSTSKNLNVCIQREENEMELELAKTDVQQWVEEINSDSSRKKIYNKKDNSIGITDCLEDEEALSLHNCSDTTNFSGIHALDSTRDSVFSGKLVYSDDEISDFDNFISIPNLRNKRSKSYTPQRPSVSFKQTFEKDLRKTLSRKLLNVSVESQAENEEKYDLLEISDSIEETCESNKKHHSGKNDEYLRNSENESNNYTPKKLMTTQFRKTMENDIKDTSKNEKACLELKKVSESYSEKPFLSSNSKKRKTLGSEPNNDSFKFATENQNHEKVLQNFDKSNTRGNRGKSVSERTLKRMQRSCRKTLGNNTPNVSFDVEVEKERLEIEEAFKNFDENPGKRSTRGRSLINETVYKDISVSPRRTMGNETFYLSFNLEVEKEKLEMEKAFENFEEMPDRRGPRGRSTHKTAVKPTFSKSRKTLGIDPRDVSFDVESERERVEVEKAFENFENIPRTRDAKNRSFVEFTTKKSFVNPRKTIAYNSQDHNVCFDIITEKERVETAKALQNIEEMPAIRNIRSRSVGEFVAKTKSKEFRKTMGVELQNISFEVESEKERVELERAFEQFEEKPTTRDVRSRSVDKSTSKKTKKKPRETVGHASHHHNVSFDIETEKERIDIERAFENFDENSTTKYTRGRSVGEYLPKTKSTKARVTMGDKSRDIFFNVESEKERAELEKAFEQFEEKPTKRDARSRSVDKSTLKKSTKKPRKTMGYTSHHNVSFDIETEKKRIEIERAFENFDENSTKKYTRGRSAGECLPKTKSTKARVTMGDKSRDISFNVESEKERVELEKAFEQFEEKPTTQHARSRSVDKSTSKKTTEKPRKTVGHASHHHNVSFDIETEKERIEIERAFENFDEDSTKKYTRGRSVGEYIPKTKSTNSRMTMGDKSRDISFNVETEKERVELEKAFEQFEEKPTKRDARSRSVDKSTLKKTTKKPRKTMGYTSHQNVSFDIEAEKERIDIERAFENFDETSTKKYTRGRSAGECLPKTKSTKARVTMCDKSRDISFNVESEKERVELEKAFEQFEEKPTTQHARSRSVDKSTAKKTTEKPRKTVGHASHHHNVSFDIETEKERLEIDRAFENFDEDSTKRYTRGRSVGEYIPKTKSTKARMTMGDKLRDISFNVENEKDRVELEKVFEQFEEKPTARDIRGRSVGMSSLKNTKEKLRNTMGHTLHHNVSFDIENEKERIEIESAFENFDENSTTKYRRGTSVGEYLLKTRTTKARTTLGLNSRDISFDVESEKERVELEKAFTNFEEKPTRGMKGRSVDQRTTNNTTVKSRKTWNYAPQDHDVPLDIDREKERFEIKRAFQNSGESVPETIMKQCRKTTSIDSQYLCLNIDSEKDKVDREKTFENFEKLGGTEKRSIGQSTPKKKSVQPEAASQNFEEKAAHTKSGSDQSVEESSSEIILIKHESDHIDIFTKQKRNDTEREFEKVEENLTINADNSVDNFVRETQFELEKDVVKKTLVKKSEKGSDKEIKSNMNANYQNADSFEDYDSTYSFLELEVKLLNAQKTISSTPTLEIKSNEGTVSVDEVKAVISEKCTQLTKSMQINNERVNSPLVKERKIKLRSSRSPNNLQEKNEASKIGKNKNESKSLMNPLEEISAMTNTGEKNVSTRPTGKASRTTNKTIIKVAHIENDLIKMTLEQKGLAKSLSTSTDNKGQAFDKETSRRRGGRLRNNKIEINPNPTLANAQEVLPREEENQNVSEVAIGRAKRVRRKVNKENSLDSEVIDKLSNTRGRRKVATASDNELNIDKPEIIAQTVEEPSEKVEVKQEKTNLEVAKKETEASEIVVSQNKSRNPRRPKRVEFKLDQEALQTNEDLIGKLESSNEVVTNKNTESIVKRTGGRRNRVKSITEKDNVDVFIPSEDLERKEKDKTSALETNEVQKLENEEATNTCATEVVSKAEKSSEVIELIDVSLSKVSRRGRTRKVNSKESILVSNKQEIEEIPKKTVKIKETPEKENQITSEIVRSRRGQRKKIENKNDEEISNNSECNRTEIKAEITRTKSNHEYIEENEESGLSESKEVETRTTRRTKKTAKLLENDDLDNSNIAKNVTGIEKAKTNENLRNEIEVKKTRGRKVDVKEEVITDSPVTRSHRARRGNQGNLVVLQDTSQTKSESLEIKKEIGSDEVQKAVSHIRKRGKRNVTEKLGKDSTALETLAIGIQKETLLLSETDDEEVPQKKIVVSGRQTNKENVAPEDMLTDVHPIRSRVRRKANNLLEISAGELTPIKPAAIAEKLHISTPTTTEQSNPLEFKTPVSAVPRARRRLRSNSTLLLTPNSYEAQDHLSRQDLSKPEINESIDNKDKSKKEVPALKRGRRLNSTKENAVNIETDEEKTKGKIDVKPSRTRAGRRKKEVESDSEGEKNLEKKKTRRNAAKEDKNSSAVNFADTDEAKLKNKADESEAGKKETYNVSEKEPTESKISQPTQAEASTEKVFPTRSTRGKRKNVVVDISTETEEVPSKRTTRSRRK